MNISTFPSRLFLLVATGAVLQVTALRAAEPNPVAPAPAAVSAEQAKFFELKVRPLLADKCFGCHGAEKQKGDLRLDSLAGHLRGGESGAAIEPGQPDASLLVEAIRYEGFEMPPSGRLDDDSVATLVRWVEMGAPWPGADPDAMRVAPPASGPTFSEEDRQWWAFQPVQDPPVPPTDPQHPAWGNQPIDAFVLPAMQAVGLTPAPPAQREALLRRLCFDLTGLPPTAEQLEQFLGDESPDAVASLVDRLLDSPRYGERWARHWLDLVRYADSDGYRADGFRPTAWRYRDYVIRSLNNDKPYDRFLQEQLAGDEMFPDDPDALIATGYLRHGIYEYNSRDARGQWSLIMNDITDTTGDVFLGLGMQCARCHDHKFDPILQKDYFRLQSFFAALLPCDDTPVATPAERDAFATAWAAWEDRTAEGRAQIAEIEKPYREKAARSAITKFPADLQAIADKTPAERTPHERQLYYLVERQIFFEYNRLESKLKKEDKDRVLELKKQLKEHDALRPKPLPAAMTVCDVGAEAPETLIPKRSKQPVAPGFVSLLDAEPAEIPRPANQASTGRRTALAKWLSEPDNPLSTRVIVNRVWQSHFGRGLAPNPSDFGRLGGPPSHPQLLDWLTTRFIENNWSLKWLHREILLSQTYQQSAVHPLASEYQQIDPANKWYWRGDVRRLDAEQIRDAVMMASGKLDLREGGPGVLPDVPRRSIYTRVMRNARDPLLDVFDLPQFFSSESSRNTTTTPVQSLLLINSPEYLQLAAAFAKRVAQASESPAEQVQQAWQIATGRLPTDNELRGSLEFLQAQQRQLDEADREQTMELTAARIPYRDGQAVALMEQASPKLPRSAPDERFDLDELTVETFFQIRSIYESGNVRTICSKWGSNSRQPGWAFGVTGKGSRRKPQTLVLHLWGKQRSGKFGEAALFSDQHIALNTPYFAAAAFQPATDAEPGTVTFYLKDLSNDDEPLQVAKFEHSIVGGLENDQPLTLGGRSQGTVGRFDGLVDDIRISSQALTQERLMYFAPEPNPQTVAYWRFESQPGVLKDSSANGLDLETSGRTAGQTSAEQAALIDFCHVLLNSNEFLYVR